MTATKIRSWILLSISALLVFTNFALGAQRGDRPKVTSAKIGMKELVGATGITLIKGDVDRRSGEVNIIGKAFGARGRIEAVEVSLDGGKTWKTAMGGEDWYYRFKPSPHVNYELVVRAINSAGLVSDPRTFGVVKLTYLPITLHELVRQRVVELAKAYMSRNLDRYMGLISRRYQQYPRGWQRLRATIKRDFDALDNIVLRFSVDQVYELEGVIMAELRWRLTYSGLTRPQQSYVEIHFDSTDQLKIILQEKDLYFGSASHRSP